MLKIIRTPEKSNGFGRVRTRELGYQRPACYETAFVREHYTKIEMRTNTTRDTKTKKENGLHLHITAPALQR